MHLGGKIAEVEEDASAFRHRACPLEMHIIWSWPSGDAEFAAQAARCAADYGKVTHLHTSTNTHTKTHTHTAHYAQRIAPYGGGSYANTDGTDTEERAAAVYGPLLQRLREAKAIADPLGLLYSPYALPQKVVELQMNAKTDGDVDPAALRLYMVPKPQPSASPP